MCWNGDSKKGAEQRTMKPLNNHSTGPFNVCFLWPKVLLFFQALRRRLLHRFNISLASQLYRIKKQNQTKPNKKRGRYKSTCQRHKIPSHLRSNFHQMDSGSQNIPPPLPHRCREVAASHLPPSGRNLPWRRYEKPLPPTACKLVLSLEAKVSLEQKPA